VHPKGVDVDDDYDADDYEADDYEADDYDGDGDDVDDGATDDEPDEDDEPPENDADTDGADDSLEPDRPLDEVRFGSTAGINEDTGNTVSWSNSFNGYYDDKTWHEVTPK
jgi:hypothetical protein